jgi:hypothetical protein
VTYAMLDKERRQRTHERAEQIMAQRKFIRGPALPPLGKTAQPIPEWALELIKEADKDRTSSLQSTYASETVNGEVVTGEVLAKRDVAQLRRAAADLDVGLRAPIIASGEGWLLSIQVGPRKKPKVAAA